MMMDCMRAGLPQDVSRCVMQFMSPVFQRLLEIKEEDRNLFVFCELFTEYDTRKELQFVCQELIHQQKMALEKQNEAFLHLLQHQVIECAQRAIEKGHIHCLDILVQMFPTIFLQQVTSLSIYRFVMNKNRPDLLRLCYLYWKLPLSLEGKEKLLHFEHVIPRACLEEIKRW